MIYLIPFIVGILIVYSLMLFFIKIKLEAFEKHIIHLFWQRNDLIPSIFEVSNTNLIKHKEIFEEILTLRKVTFSEKNISLKLHDIIQTQARIHNELNFIFRVCNKHKKLLKQWKFIYIKDLIIKKSFEIWNALETYKKIIAKYNTLITIKQISIVWLIIPFSKKPRI